LFRQADVRFLKKWRRSLKDDIHQADGRNAIVDLLENLSANIETSGISEALLSERNPSAEMAALAKDYLD
jgi:hypothetical protein